MFAVVALGGGRWRGGRAARAVVRGRAVWSPVAEAFSRQLSQEGEPRKREPEEEEGPEKSLGERVLEGEWR